MYLLWYWVLTLWGRSVVVYILISTTLLAGSPLKQLTGLGVSIILLEQTVCCPQQTGQMNIRALFTVIGIGARQ